jgi:hypothetical protein
MSDGTIKWHIYKSCRLYVGFGYSGPSCQAAGVEPGKTYDSYVEADADRNKLNQVNPVGFLIAAACPLTQPYLP